MKPSFLSSTLSVMAVISLLTIVYCIIINVTIQAELLWVLTAIIWVYTWARAPNTKTEAEHSKSIHDVNDLSERP